MASLVITKGLYDSIVSHARSVYPEEACGLIAGHIECCDNPIHMPEDDPVPEGVAPEDIVPSYGKPDGIVKVVERVVPLENIDHSPEHFTIDMGDQLRVLKDMRANGLVILGNFHSHPATPARPSAEDKRLLNDPSASYLIVSLAGDDPVLNAFQIEGDVAHRELLQEVDSPVS